MEGKRKSGEGAGLRRVWVDEGVGKMRVWVDEGVGR